MNCRVLLSRVFSCEMSRSSWRVFARMSWLHFLICRIQVSDWVGGGSNIAYLRLRIGAKKDGLEGLHGGCPIL